MKRNLLFKTMLLLCALVVGTSSSWATDVTFDATTDQSSTSSLEKNGITITISNGTLENGTDYRCYKGATMTISSTVGNITSITFTSTTSSYAGYIKLSGSTPGSLNVSNTTTTWTYATGVTSAEFKGKNSSNSNEQIRASQIVVTYTPTSSDPSSDVTFANSSPSMDLKNASTFTQTATTAEGYAETTGASVTYEMTNNTAGATIDENTGEVTPTHAGSVSVKATASAIDGHFTASSASYTLTVTDTREFTITCHIGNNTNNVVRSSGATLNLDNPASILGMSFVGWSSSNDVESPVWIANSTKVTGEMELYAIYQAVEGEYSYHLVEADQSDWRGDYLIAYSNTVFANGKEYGASGLGSSSTTKNPGSNLSGKIVNVTWGDQYYVSLEAIDDEDLSKGYLLKTQDDYYNYQTSDANGLSGYSKNKVTASAYPITIDYISSSEINITLDKGQVFRYNKSQAYFRFYKSSTYTDQAAVYLYKRTMDVEPVYSLGVSATITTAEYATFSSPYATDFSSTGITVYTAADNETSVTLNEIITGKVPANTPVVLYKAGADGTAIDVPVITSADPVGENDLAVVEDADGKVGVANMFVLSKPAGKEVGFYAWKVGETLNKGKVYLQGKDYGSGAREFLGFNEGNTTGIANLNVDANTNFDANAPMYNLAGQRVNKSYKGVVIVNGKKFVIK